MDIVLVVVLLIMLKQEWNTKKNVFGMKIPYDGEDQVSIGQQVTAWTTRDRDSLKVKNQ